MSPAQAPPPPPTIYPYRYGGRVPLIDGGKNRMLTGGATALGTRQKLCCCPPVSLWTKWYACPEEGECHDPPAEHVYVPLSYWPNEELPPTGTVMKIVNYCFIFHGETVEAVPPGEMEAFPDDPTTYPDCPTCCAYIPCPECDSPDEPPEGYAYSYEVLIEDLQIELPCCGLTNVPFVMSIIWEGQWDYHCWGLPNGFALWTDVNWQDASCHTAPTCAQAQCWQGAGAYGAEDELGILCRHDSGDEHNRWVFWISAYVPCGDIQYYGQIRYSKPMTPDDYTPEGAYPTYDFFPSDSEGGGGSGVELISPGTCTITAV